MNRADFEQWWKQVKSEPKFKGLKYPCELAWKEGCCAAKRHYESQESKEKSK